MLRTAPALLLLTAALACADASHPRPPSAECRSREASATPAGFVYVRGGECLLGTDDPDASEDARPARRAFLPSFYISRCEVSQAEWKRFRPAYSIPAGHERDPITNVGFEEALAYCRSVGGRLPTDAEWEKAARGPGGRRYPWGETFDGSRCNLRSPLKHAAGVCLAKGARRGLKPVDAYPQGASPCGALNMAGNAWEWVSDFYGGEPERRIIRGGAVGYSEREARAYSRGIEGAGVT